MKCNHYFSLLSFLLALPLSPFSPLFLLFPFSLPSKVNWNQLEDLGESFSYCLEYRSPSAIALLILMLSPDKISPLLSSLSPLPSLLSSHLLSSLSPLSSLLFFPLSPLPSPLHRPSQPIFKQPFWRICKYRKKRSDKSRGECTLSSLFSEGILSSLLSSPLLSLLSSLIFSLILPSPLPFLKESTAMTNLALAGGVALNSVLNGRVMRESGFDQVRHFD